MTDCDQQCELLATARAGGDCTALLQARLAELAAAGGGVFHFPNRSAVYRTTDTLTLPLGVSLAGPPGVAIVEYHGDPANPAIRVDRNWGYRLQGVGVRRAGEDKTGVGIEVVPDPAANVPPAGTRSGNAVWDQVSVYGFAVGAQLGHPTEHHATSEITFNQCVFVNNDTGVRLSSFDTLNMVFINLGISGNRIGLHADTGGRVLVLGGTASRNAEQDFRVQHAHGFAATGFRSEDGNSLFRGPGVTAPSVVTLTNCTAHQRADAPDAAVILASGGRCGLYQCAVGGRVECWSNGGGGGLAMDGCTVRDDRPCRVTGDGGTPPWWVRVSGCSQVDAGNEFVRRFPDWTGLFGSGQDAVVDPFGAA